nr:MAG TPA_asm: hypothetical protein [Caudoviricetes sp.]
MTMRIIYMCTINGTDIYYSIVLVKLYSLLYTLCN